MGELGFWRLAGRDPDRIALVTPDGDEVTAGELVAAANRVTHGLRSLGLERGDTVAVVLPNGRTMIEVYLGAMQMGLYLTPINHHLVGPEIAYILDDSDATVLVGHERFASRAGASRSRDEPGRRGPLRRGRRRGLAPRGRADRGPARHHPREAGGGLTHALHLGHDRPAQGRQARHHRHRP